MIDNMKENNIDMKKICIITTVSDTLKSFVLEFAQYMYSHGDYDITFICNRDEEFANSLPEYIHYLPVDMKRGISISGFAACFKMIKIFKENKYDIIQYSTPNASLYASIAGWIARIPVRLYCQWGLVYVGFSGFRRKIFKCEEKLVCKLSSWIEPDSKGNLKFCRDQKLYPAEKSSVVHKGSASGVSLEKFTISKKNEYRKEVRKQWNIPEQDFVYGFVGRITGDKGINELLLASNKILKTYKDVHVLLIGGVEKESSVNAELYEWSKKEKRIKYCGKTSEAEKYMAAMDCYVMPSYREGFGLTVIEAGAMGVPVICTDIPGPTDAIIDGVTGLVVKKKDSDALESAILKLYSDRALGKRLGNAGFENVKKNYEQKELFKHILEDRNRLLKTISGRLE